MDNRENALVVCDLVKDYGSKRAVKGVSFTIKRGEIFGLLGPNGAGKTTIISTLVTLAEPTSGSIHIFGIDLKKNPRKAKQMMGVVPQELIHYGFFTVGEILRYHAAYYGISLTEKALDQMLYQLHLYEKKGRLVKQLSGGMKRRLLIAKALLHEPKLLLLDEPTSGVDIELRGALWEFIQKLKKKGVSILLTTHYLEEAERLCDRIAILDEGKLTRVDQTKRLIEEHSLKKITLHLAEPIPQIEHPFVVKQNAHCIELEMPNEVPFLKVVRETKIPFDVVRDVDVKMGTLEDVMQKVTWKGRGDE